MQRSLAGGGGPPDRRMARDPPPGSALGAPPAPPDRGAGRRRLHRGARQPRPRRLRARRQRAGAAPGVLPPTAAATARATRSSSTTRSRGATATQPPGPVQPHGQRRARPAAGPGRDLRRRRNTVNLLAVWRAQGIDAILREAWERGVVLAGLCAGSMCWFEGGVTASFGHRLSHSATGSARCRAATARTTGSPRRLHGGADGGLAPGLAADDGVALHFVDRRLAAVVASRQGGAPIGWASPGTAWSRRPSGRSRRRRGTRPAGAVEPPGRVAPGGSGGGPRRTRATSGGR